LISILSKPTFQSHSSPPSRPNPELPCHRHKRTPRLTRNWLQSRRFRSTFPASVSTALCVCSFSGHRGARPPHVPLPPRARSAAAPAVPGRSSPVEAMGRRRCRRIARRPSPAGCSRGGLGPPSPRARRRRSTPAPSLGRRGAHPPRVPSPPRARSIAAPAVPVLQFLGLTDRARKREMGSLALPALSSSCVNPLGRQGGVQRDWREGEVGGSRAGDCSYTPTGAAVPHTLG
jgi:hypothetical protein